MRASPYSVAIVTSHTEWVGHEGTSWPLVPVNGMSSFHCGRRCRPQCSLPAPAPGEMAAVKGEPIPCLDEVKSNTTDVSAPCSDWSGTPALLPAELEEEP